MYEVRQRWLGRSAAGLDRGDQVQQGCGLRYALVQMTVNRCDFQVPPAVPGRYGILSEAESNAAFSNGTDWAEYPVRAYARSRKALETEEAAFDWTRLQPDSIQP
jgi:hypothetical protein